MLGISTTVKAVSKWTPKQQKT